MRSLLRRHLCLKLGGGRYSQGPTKALSTSMAASTREAPLGFDVSFEGELELLELMGPLRGLPTREEGKPPSSPLITEPPVRKPLIRTKKKLDTAERATKASVEPVPLHEGHSVLKGKSAKELVYMLDLLLSERMPVMEGATQLEVLQALRRRLIELSPKESIHLCRQLHGLLHQEQWSSIVSTILVESLYLHRSVTRRYFNVVSIQLIRTVPTNGLTKDKQSLKTALLDHALWRLISTKESNASFILGEQVSKILLETLFLSWSDISDSVRVACMIWIRRHSKNMMRCFSIALDETLEYNEKGKVDYNPLFKRAERHIKRTNQVVSFDKTILSFLRSGIPSLSSSSSSPIEKGQEGNLLQETQGGREVVHLLSELSGKDGVPYIQTVHHICQILLTLKSVREIEIVVERVVAEVPVLSTTLFGIFTRLLQTQLSAFASQEDQQVRILSLFHLMFPHCDALNGAMHVAYLLASYVPSENHRTAAKEWQLLDRLKDEVKYYIPASLIPVFLEQFGVEREVAPLPCNSITLAYLSSLLGNVDVRLLSGTAIQKSLLLFITSERTKREKEGKEGESAKDDLTIIGSYVTDIDGYLRRQKALSHLFGSHPVVNLFNSLVDLTDSGERHILHLEKMSLILNSVELEARIFTDTASHFFDDPPRLSLREKQLLRYSEGGDPLPDQLLQQVQTAWTDSHGFAHFRSLQQRAHFETLTVTLIRFFSAVTGAVHWGYRPRSDRSHLQAVRRKLLNRLPDVETQTIDSLLHYLFLPSQLCVLSKRQVGRNGIEEKCVDSQALSSVSLSKRLTLAGGKDVYTALSRCAFEFLGPYYATMMTELQSPSPRSEDRAALFRSWCDWMKRVLFYNTSDLLVLAALDSPECQLAHGCSVEVLIQAYRILLDTYSSVDVEESRQLFPPELHRVVLEYFVDYSFRHPQSPPLLHQIVEGHGELVAKLLSTHWIQKLVFTYVAANQPVPSTLKDALRKK